MSVFQERLKEIIEERHIKPAHIAKATGISPSAISKYLSDKNKKAEFDKVLKIAYAIDIDPSWLGGLPGAEKKPFKKPYLLNVYETLSDAGKEQVVQYAKFVQRDEGRTDENNK